MNFSLRTLLVFTAGVAVVVASLVYPAPIVGDLFYTAGLLTIAGAAIAAIYERGTRRAYWIGFLVMFAAYYTHTVWPSELRSTWTLLQHFGEIPYPTPGMVTTRLLWLSYEGLHGDVAIVSGFFQPRSPTAEAAAEQFIAFQTVGHTAIATLLGVFGGAFARRLSKKKRPFVPLTEEQLR